MTERERLERLAKRWQPEHHSFFARPYYSRRCFFRDAVTGVGGFFLARPLARANSGVTSVASAVPRGTAKSVIFLFLRGGPSHVDTFDFREFPGTTPKSFAPEVFDGVTLPTGLLSNTARVLDRIAIIRSASAWARAHPLAQKWMQVGREPTTTIGRVAPHIGSVVAVEKERERRADQVFPPFIALNPKTVSGSGFLPAEFSPFRTKPSPEGLAGTFHNPGREVFRDRWQMLEEHSDLVGKSGSGLGSHTLFLRQVYQTANSLMYNPAIEAAFKFTKEESQRYGRTHFGDAVLTARKILEQDQGTRFIQVDHANWDHHANIYGYEGNNTLDNQMKKQFDPAFAALIEDLHDSGRLDETLVIACGEFGRTPGALSATAGGRDHYLQMFYVLAGGGVRGGKVLGATNDVGGRGAGSFTTEPGWHRDRDIRPEDIEATIYSALGIDWTTLRHADALGGRGFRYVPLSDDDVYAPVDELWV